MAGGLLLFALDVWVTIGRTVTAGVVGGTATISAGRIEALEAGYIRSFGRRPDAQERRALVEQAVTREILYREALARGLDRNDSGVRYRLAEKMRFIAGERAAADENKRESLYRQALALELDRDDLVLRRLLVQKMRLLLRAGASVPQPSDEQLMALMRDHAQEYEQPARVDLQHVFFSSDGAGTARARERALAALASARQEEPQGDPFMPGSRFSSASHSLLLRVFGSVFADAAMQLEGDNWQGPIESAYGWHLLMVGNRRPASLPPLHVVQSRLLAAAKHEAGERAYREGLDELRQAWTVSVQSPPAVDANKVLR